MDTGKVPADGAAPPTSKANTDTTGPKNGSPETGEEPVQMDTETKIEEPNNEEALMEAEEAVTASEESLARVEALLIAARARVAGDPTPENFEAVMEAMTALEEALLVSEDKEAATIAAFIRAGLPLEEPDPSEVAEIDAQVAAALAAAEAQAAAAAGDAQAAAAPAEAQAAAPTPAMSDLPEPLLNHFCLYPKGTVVVLLAGDKEAHVFYELKHLLPHDSMQYDPRDYPVFSRFYPDPVQAIEEGAAVVLVFRAREAIGSIDIKGLGVEEVVQRTMELVTSKD